MINTGTQLMHNDVLAQDREIETQREALEIVLRIAEEKNSNNIHILENFDIEHYIQLNDKDMHEAQNKDVINAYCSIKNNLERIKACRMSEIKETKKMMEERYKNAPEEQKHEAKAELLQYYRHQKQKNRQSLYNADSAKSMIRQGFTSNVNEAITIDKNIHIQDTETDADIVRMRTRILRCIDPNDTKQVEYMNRSDIQRRKQSIRRKLEDTADAVCRIVPIVISPMHILYLVAPEQSKVILNILTESTQLTYACIVVLTLLLSAFLCYVLTENPNAKQKRKSSTELYEESIQGYRKEQTGTVVGTVARCVYAVCAGVVKVCTVVYLASMSVMPLCMAVLLACLFSMHENAVSGMAALFYTCALCAYVGASVYCIRQLCFGSDGGQEGYSSIQSIAHDVIYTLVFIILVLLIMIVCKEGESVFAMYLDIPEYIYSIIEGTMRETVKHAMKQTQ